MYEQSVMFSYALQTARFPRSVVYWFENNGFAESGLIYCGDAIKARGPLHLHSFRNTVVLVVRFGCRIVGRNDNT